MNDVVLEAAKRLAAAGIDTSRLDARLLWQHAQQFNPPLEGSDSGSVSDAERSDAVGSKEIMRYFESLVARREKREPIAYILGRKEFWSLDIHVGPGVLVPRPDTETLIDEALRLIPDRAAPLRIVDLGTGSGALLIAALTEFPNATGVGFESSDEAFKFAFHNAAMYVPDRAEIRLADWAGAQGPFELVFSNPPYIRSSDVESLAPDVSQFEPRAALDGGADGLDAYRSLAGLLPNLLKSGGHALLEIGQGQANDVASLFQTLELIRITPDLSGLARCLVLRKP